MNSEYAENPFGRAGPRPRSGRLPYGHATPRSRRWLLRCRRAVPSRPARTGWTLLVRDPLANSCHRRGTPLSAWTRRLRQLITAFISRWALRPAWAPDRTGAAHAGAGREVCNTSSRLRIESRQSTRLVCSRPHCFWPKSRSAHMLTAITSFTWSILAVISPLPIACITHVSTSDKSIRSASATALYPSCVTHTTCVRTVAHARRTESDALAFRTLALTSLLACARETSVSSRILSPHAATGSLWLSMKLLLAASPAKVRNSLYVSRAMMCSNR